MCSTKPKSLFPGRLFSESEKGCKVKIGDETEYVTYAVGYVDIDDLLEYNIYSIVQGGSKDAYHNETDKCRSLFQSLHVHRSEMAKLGIVAE